MSLINCPECNKEISDSVKKCPACGYKIKKHKGQKEARILKTSKQKILFKIILIIVIIVLLGVGGFFGYTNYIVPLNAYNAAKALVNEQKFDDDGNGVIGVEESGEIVGGIVFMDVDIDASPSDDEFKSAKDELLNKVAEVVSAKAGTPEETTLCGYTAVKAELHSDKLIGCTILYIVPDSKSISAVLAMYTPDTEYDYIPDFERILESAKINDAVEETSADGVTPEFKAKMDSLEAFFDEYVDFMNTYLNAASSGDVMSMMSKYMNFLNKYTDAMSDLEDIDEVNLSAADYAYYVEVYGRIMQKLLKVVG